MHLIGLDVGTTGCKAIVFSLDGRILGQSFHAYDVVCREPAMAEQDAEHVWTLTRHVLRDAVVRSGVQDLVALSVSVQGDAVIPVDERGHALHPAILGMDYRSQRQARECEEKCGAFALFQRTGMRSHPLNSITKILLLRDLAPAVYAKAWKFVTYADFMLGRLGAEHVIDYTMASRTMAFDLATRTWSREILGRLDLDASRFSRPVASGTPVGTIRHELASDLGVPASLILAAGGHDQPCAGLGAGVVREHLAVVSTGTAEVLSTAFNSPALTRQMFDSFYPCYLHAKDGMYFTFALNHAGGILLQWYRDNLGLPEVEAAQSQDCDPYGLIDARMPAGPSPLMVLPHLNGSGTPWCDLQAKGAVLGLTMASTRHDIAKAMLEGLTFELLINLLTMQQCGVRVTELVAAGGGAKSGLWLQLKADILNRPIRTLRCRESACLGKVFANSIQALTDTLEALDLEQYRKAVDALLSAGKLALFGLGNAAVVAREAYQEFLRIGVPCYTAEDPDLQLIIVNSQLAKGDVLIAISYSGESRPILTAARQAQERGVKVLAVTNFPRSSLAKSADLVLVTAVFQEHVNGEVGSKRLAQLCVLESLYGNYLLRKGARARQNLVASNRALGINKTHNYASAAPI